MFPSTTSLTRRSFTVGAVSTLAAAVVAQPAGARTATTVQLGSPLPQAHAHNDYEHDRPLLDALSHGFTSVEADVWLVDGELLVAHDSWELDDAPTLREAYLEPLSRIVSPNGKRLYPGYDGVFQLLIDIKSDGAATWPVIEEQLAEYGHLFTRVHNGRVKARAVQAVISGNRPLEMMQTATTRHSFYDGRAEDLASGWSADFMPLVSHNWTRLFTWQGIGEMPAWERERLHAYVEQAHAAGYRVRFWATNDIAGQARENLWAELQAAGVDHINTDDLAGLEEFLSR